MVNAVQLVFDFTLLGHFQEKAPLFQAFLSHAGVGVPTDRLV